jgi:hypothetical protein
VLLTVIGVFLLALFASVTLSVSIIPGSTKISFTTQALEPASLNFTAYDVHRPGNALMTLSYTFPPTINSGILNLTSSWGMVSGTSFSPCSSLNSSQILVGTNLTGGDIGYDAYLPVNNCGVYFFTEDSQLSYLPNLYTTIFFAITVTNDSVAGTYLFYPPGGQCGYHIYLIVGSEVPGSLPPLATVNCHYLMPRPSPMIAVIGTEDLQGLNLSR